jgi:glycosyltransferase involved in cell wall biosynthesis
MNSTPAFRLAPGSGPAGECLVAGPAHAAPMLAAPAVIRARTPFSAPRVALVHYWLVGMRGGERVLERILHLWPKADLFTHVYVPEAVSAAIRARPVRTSFIARLPGARRHYQKYLPLMPLALEQLDLSAYDLVISSESGPAKGVIARPDAAHVAYVHSPMRYLWDHYHEYRGAAGPLARWAIPGLFHYLRSWDAASAARVDRLVANSTFIRRRVARAWGREADVVHPPVAVEAFRPAAEVTPRYLWVGQMIAYKRPEIVLDAFNRLRLPLLMVGDGPLHEAMRRRAGPTVEVVRRLDFARLRQAYAEAQALVFSAHEDFGIVPVEANASGRPVLAYGRGGVTDSIVPGATGQFFAEQTAEAVIAGVEALEQWLGQFDPAAAVANAARFAPERFDAGFRAVVEQAL